jgi:endonuclease III
LNCVRRHLHKRPQSRHVFPSTQASTFGLIQESIAHNLYFLVIQAILWNQTSGIQARPIFFDFIKKYPDPTYLSQASLADLTALLRPLGLQNTRARRFIALAVQWNKKPPTAEQIYFRKGYPAQSLATDINEGYEIAHLTGVGPYALDSFRIFHRDEMRGLAKDWLGTGSTIENFEPEWTRVLPQDKELRAYVKWRWLKEGLLWDDETGQLECSKATPGVGL